MSQVSGPKGEPTPSEIYRDQFNRGLKLFEKALTEYQNTDEIHKKAKLQSVMDKALDVINKTASQILKDKGIDAEKKLNDDYASYLTESSDKNYEKLNQDVTQLRNIYPR